MPPSKQFLPRTLNADWLKWHHTSRTAANAPFFPHVYITPPPESSSSPHRFHLTKDPAKKTGPAEWRRIIRAAESARGSAKNYANPLLHGGSAELMFADESTMRAHPATARKCAPASHPLRSSMHHCVERRITHVSTYALRLYLSQMHPILSVSIHLLSFSLYFRKPATTLLLILPLTAYQPSNTPFSAYLLATSWHPEQWYQVWTVL